MLFEYSGRDSEGKLVEGTLEASNLESALKDLKRRQVLPSKLQPGKKKSSSNISAGALQKQWKELQMPPVKHDDLIMFCRQMFALMKAGIPLLRAISGLAETARNERLKITLRDVLKNLQGGTELATALAHHDIFSSLFVSMIRMGETTGRIDQAFQQLIYHLEQEKETRKRIIATIRYPSFVIAAIFVAVTIINMKVIPSFATVFEQFGSDLPFATKILIAMSEFSVKYWWAVIIGAVVAASAWIHYLKTERGRFNWDRIKLKIPLIGHILERITISRFTRPFAMMLDAGVPLIQALTVSARTVGNEYVGFHIESMIKGIERGDTILNTAGNTGMFNPLVLQMLAVGEETGNISDMLNDISDFYDQEIDYDLKKLADNIEPILLIVMGVLVLILALGVFLPMWDLSAAARS